MKKYIKNASKWAMLAVAAFAMFLFSFNTSAQEPECDVSTHLESFSQIVVGGQEVTVCEGIGDDCLVAVITCDRQ